MTRFEKFCDEIDNNMFDSIWTIALMVSLAIGMPVMAIAALIGGIEILYKIFKYLPFLIAVPVTFVLIIAVVSIIIWLNQQE